MTSVIGFVTIATIVLLFHLAAYSYSLSRFRQPCLPGAFIVAMRNEKIKEFTGMGRGGVDSAKSADNLAGDDFAPSNEDEAPAERTAIPAKAKKSVKDRKSSPTNASKKPVALSRLSSSAKNEGLIDLQIIEEEIKLAETKKELLILARTGTNPVLLEVLQQEANDFRESLKFLRGSLNKMREKERKFLGHIIENTLTEIKSFRHRDESAQQAFDRYNLVGAVLRNSPEIISIEKVVEECQSDSRHGFSSLIVPSCTGKTQSVFAFTKPVFYFSFDSMKLYGQEIYKCFDGLVSRLLFCAEKDFVAILGRERERGNIKEPIFNSDMLAACFDYNTPSFIIGFLASLIEESNQRTKSVSWMDFYTRNRELPVSSMIANDFEAKYKDQLLNFVVVLDEFPSQKETDSAVPEVSIVYFAALIRNIIRKLGLPCLVMGTNTQVTNLIGTREATGSGEDVARLFWCSVNLRLPGMEFGAIEKDFIEAKNAVLDAAASNETMCAALNGMMTLIEAQVRSSRPGIGVLLVSCLKTPEFLGEVNESCSKRISFPELFGCFCSQFYLMLHDRKPSLRDSKSYRGSVKLLHPNVIGEESNAASLINDHLFYLQNPIGSNKIPTFDLSLNGENAITFRGKKWIPKVYTYPLQDECFLYLGCWGGCLPDQGIFYKNQQSFGNFFVENNEVHNTRKLADSNVNAEISDGNSWEYFCTTAIMLGSHGNGFLGVPAAEFIRSTLSHVLELDDTSKLHLSGNISLPNVIVPYLGPWSSNIRWPPELLILKAYGLRMGRCWRNPNKDMRDSQFDVLDGGKDMFGYVEMKNWRDAVSFPNLVAIYERMLNASSLPAIHFTFVRRLVRRANKNNEHITKLTEMAKKNGLQFFVIKKKISDCDEQYDVRPLLHDISLNTQNPIISCFIFEIEDSQLKR